MKLYHWSVRLQYSGRSSEASCTRSATLSVASVTADAPSARVPRMSVKNCQSGSVSIAEWIPRNPPPSWKYSSKAACWVSLSTSPDVFRNTTAR